MDLEKWLNDDGGDIVEVEEMGGSVYIKPITTCQLSMCKKKAALRAPTLRLDEDSAATLEMIAVCVLDVDTKTPLFGSEEVPKLAEMPVARLTPLIEAMSRINGFDVDGVEELAEKSSAREVSS